MRVRPSPSGRSIDLLTYAATAAALVTTLYEGVLPVPQELAS